jgi:hypothetical protein
MPGNRIFIEADLFKYNRFLRCKFLSDLMYFFYFLREVICSFRLLDFCFCLFPKLYKDRLPIIINSGERNFLFVFIIIIPSINKMLILIAVYNSCIIKWIVMGNPPISPLKVCEESVTFFNSTS